MRFCSYNYECQEVTICGIQARDRLQEASLGLNIQEPATVFQGQEKVFVAGLEMQVKGSSP